MSKRFPFLSFISLLFRIFGVVVMIPGIYLCYAGVASTLAWARIEELGVPVPPFIACIAGFVAILVGLGAVLVGEVVGVLFAIEANTRAAKI